jgi:hypothetical protein
LKAALWLLPQSGGFEGVGVVLEELRADYQASAQGVNPCDLQVGVGTATGGPPDGAHNDLVPGSERVTDEIQGVQATTASRATSTF